MSSSGLYGDVAYRCIHPGGKHLLKRPAVSSRRMTDHHPSSSGTCTKCGRIHDAAFGQLTGRGFTYSVFEQAEALLALGRGDTYRRVAQTAHRNAYRARQAPRPTCKGRAWLPRGQADANGRTDVEWDKYDYSSIKPAGSLNGPYSKSATVITGWVDVFAPHILEAFAPAAMPRVLAIDSKPIKRRSWDVNPFTGSVAVVAGGERNGEIMAVCDASVSPAAPLMLVLEGGKDSESWLRTFAKLPPGEPPEWVVADLDSAIDLAVRTAWPDAILFRCEEHLRETMRDALRRDGVPAKITPEAAKQLGAKPRTKKPVIKRRGDVESVDHPLFRLVGRSVISQVDWDAFKAGVERYLPNAGEEIRKWIGDNEELIVSQFALREAHPDKPFSTGAPEGLLGVVENAFGERTEFFANANRLDLLLGLIRVEEAGLANVAVYSELVAKVIEGRSGTGLDWQDGRDVLGSSSIDERIEQAIDIAAASAAKRLQDGNVARRTARTAAVDAERSAAGLEPTNVGRTRRLDGPAHTHYKIIPGQTVADIPELAAQWRPELNDGKLASEVRAGSGYLATWACDDHLAEHGHLHLWKRKVIDRATSRTRCPVLANKQTCEVRNLAAQYPDLMAEWSTTLNPTLNPAKLLPGSNFPAWWKCANPAHLAFERPIAQRTKQHSRCPRCVSDAAKAKGLARQAAFGQRGRRINREARGDVRPPVIGVGAVPGTPGPDDLKLADVATRTGRTTQTLRNWIRAGRLAAIEGEFAGRPAYWVTPAELERILAFIQPPGATPDVAA